MAEDLRPLTMQDLYADKSLCSKVITLLDEKRSYKFILDFINSQGYSYSKASLTNFKHKVDESRQRQISLGDLINKRRKTSISQVKQDNIRGYLGNAHQVRSNSKQTNRSYNDDTVSPVKCYSARQVLEDLINRGFQTMQNLDVVDVPSTLKAVDLYEKYFGEDTKGLTSEALKQYQIIEQANIQAISKIIAKYIPSDKQAEVYQELDKETTKYLQQLGVTSEGKQLLKELRQAGISL